MEDICGWSNLQGKYCPSSTTRGFSTISIMRIKVLPGDRVGDPLHTDSFKGGVGASQVFMEILGFKVGKNFGRSKRRSGIG